MLSILGERLPVLEAPSCQAVTAASEGLANAERTEAGGKSEETGCVGCPCFHDRMREMSALESEGKAGD